MFSSQILQNLPEIYQLDFLKTKLKLYLTQFKDGGDITSGFFKRIFLRIYFLISKEVHFIILLNQNLTTRENVKR
jgi:hypothetical protein